MLKKGAWLGDKAPPDARDSSEVAYALNRRCLAHTGNDGLNFVFWSSNLSLLVEFSIQDEAMAVVWLIPKWAHYLVDVNTLLLKIENYKGSVELMVLLIKAYTFSVPDQHSTSPRRTAHTFDSRGKATGIRPELHPYWLDVPPSQCCFISQP